MTFSGGSNPNDDNDCALLMTMIDNQQQPLGVRAVAKFSSREAFEAFVEWVRGATMLCLELQNELANARQQQQAKRIITPGDAGFGKPIPRA